MDLNESDLYLLSQCAVSAAYQAGKIITDYSTRSLAVRTKPGGTSLAAQVVTEVDHLSQAIILKTLLPSCRIYDQALLSEESPDDRERLNKEYFWSIDPLDGTLPFIESTPGYSVSISLLSRDGISQIGVVFDPVEQNLYQAVKGNGAFLNGQAIDTKTTSPSTEQTLTFITDKSFAKDPLYETATAELEKIALNLGFRGSTLLLQGGAAMNACQVLSLAPACYFKFPKPQQGGGSVWDYSATACLFNELGLPVSDSNGRPLRLNPPNSTFMNHCGVLYASDNSIAEQMIRLSGRLVAVI